MPKKLFNPRGYLAKEDHAHAHFGERGAGQVYLWDRKTVFAVQVAQTTSRPLLLRGPAGSGKSSLAPFVANTLGCRFYGHTVSARTQARDLMWEFDALQRLNDANVAKADSDIAARVKNLHNYVTPGALWWGFDPKSAAARGATDKEPLDPLVGESRDPATIDPARPGETIEPPSPGAVVLIDEIDKADPDVPNNLLEALGSRQFTVAETKTKVRDTVEPLVMITTNDERELPGAFLRRCIVLHLGHRDPHQLVDIAVQHFDRGAPDGPGRKLYLPVALRLEQLRAVAEKKGHRPPSTAEYLDALSACIELGVEPESDDGDKKQIWEQLVEVSLAKTKAPEQTLTPGAAENGA